ncbi:MAG TPA: STAS domain-containing protein [Gaiellales bacterium]|jgi:anti-anti-sigma factor|nr:STAS domain-containing protein [Gaiellales bacterium]
MNANERGQQTVELAQHAPDIAIATLRGEHDLDSRAELDGALTRGSEHSFLLVDLSECGFLDSTVIGLLVVTCQRMWERDGRLELVVPAEAAALQRVMEIAGLTTFLTIHETRSEGIAAMEAAG